MLQWDVGVCVGVWIVGPVCATIGAPTQVPVVFCGTLIACPREAVIHCCVNGYGNGGLGIGFDSRRVVMIEKVVGPEDLLWGEERLVWERSGNPLDSAGCVPSPPGPSVPRGFGWGSSGWNDDKGEVAVVMANWGLGDGCSDRQ